MVSSITAMAQVYRGGVQVILDYAFCLTEESVTEKPIGIKLLVREKQFCGQLSPISFVLTDGEKDIIGLPSWVAGQSKDRSSQIRKAKIAVKRYTVIQIEDYDVKIHGSFDRAPYLQLHKYTIVKRIITQTEFEHWLEHGN